jgi:hypothetical protein
MPGLLTLSGTPDLHHPANSTAPTRTVTKKTADQILRGPERHRRADGDHSKSIFGVRRIVLP